MTSPFDFPATFPTLTAGSFTLRAIQASDTPALRTYLSDPEVIERTSYEVPTRREIDGLVQFYAHAFATRSAIRWAIAESAAKPIVGTCGLSAFSEKHQRAELGYELAREAWGQGVATAVAARVVSFAFEELALHRVEATVMAGNARSERVLEKLGFAKEGVLRGYKLARGEFRDYSIWAVLRDGWKPPAGEPEGERTGG